MCSTGSRHSASGRRMGCWFPNDPGLRKEHPKMNNAVLPTPETVAVYLRVSSQAQRQRETIASQREAVLEYARSRGWSIPHERVFADDGFSGATLDRPALEALRDLVASGVIATATASLRRRPQP